MSAEPYRGPSQFVVTGWDLPPKGGLSSPIDRERFQYRLLEVFGQFRTRSIY